MKTRLHEYVAAEGIPVAHACEVGVWRPEFSNMLGWIAAGTRTTLVECDPAIVTELRTQFGGAPHVRIVDVAVADVPGELTLYRAGASTFGANVPRSPAIVNDGFEVSKGESFTVPAVTFDTLDDGTIDVLAIDVEGGEWFVLRHLRSRPAIVSIETHGKRYTNPFLREIEGWMAANGYGAWYRDRSDTVYRKGWTRPVEDRAPPPTTWQKIKKAVRGW